MVLSESTSAPSIDARPSYQDSGGIDSVPQHPYYLAMLYFSLSDKNVETGMLLEGPWQGQAEREFMLDANTPSQDLLRSCVTEGIRR